MEQTAHSTLLISHIHLEQVNHTCESIQHYAIKVQFKQDYYNASVFMYNVVIHKLANSGALHCRVHSYQRNIFNLTKLRKHWT